MADAPRRRTPKRDLVIPHNLEAEESLLGAALLAEDALEVLTNEVEPDDFYKPAHANLAATMREMYLGGLTVDPVTVNDELVKREMAEVVGGIPALLSLEARTPATSNARRYAQIIIDHAVRRRFIEAGWRAYEDGQTLDYSVEQLFERARKRFGTIDMSIVPGEPDADVHTFLEGHEEYDWLIWGLLERKDRLIITGGEGGGKSTMLRQFAVCAAAGIHPFEGRRIDPVNVLVVDCENSEVQVRRKLRPLVGKAANEIGGAFNPDNLRINIKTDGLDLMQRMDVRWLIERIEANQPELLIIGPLYKLHAGDPVDESPARHVSRALDLIRNRYGCALLIEAHSPYGTVDGKRIGRPYGASLWSRWPEFGYCIVTDKDNPTTAQFESWRGPRDERNWPTELTRGSKLDEREWPWQGSGQQWDRRIDHLHRDGPPPPPSALKAVPDLPPDPPGVDEEPW